MDSDEDASSEPRLGEERGGTRRFFGRRRKFSGDVAAFSTMAPAEQRHHIADAAPQGPLRRRMSHVMTRRNRTLPTVSSGSSEGRIEGDDGGDAVTATSKESLHDAKSGDAPLTDTRGGVGQGGLDSVTEAHREKYGAEGEAGEKAKEAEPPPFTMALAVMLTGLRLFVVDQVWSWDGGTRVRLSSMRKWLVTIVLSHCVDASLNRLRVPRTCQCGRETAGSKCETMHSGNIAISDTGEGRTGLFRQMRLHALSCNTAIYLSLSYQMCDSSRLLLQLLCHP